MAKKTDKPADRTGTDGSYGADDLTHLEGLDAVRLRPGMYIGSTDRPGIYGRLIAEIVDNAVDEAMAGRCSRIGITVGDDGSVTVDDDGAGIPTGMNAKTGMSGVTLVFTKLHAGGKFGGGGYKVSGGLHGVGASVVNALSARLDVTVRRDGRRYEHSFSRGVPGRFKGTGPAAKFTSGGELRDVARSAKKDGTGTSVQFWPDEALLTGVGHVDADALRERAERTAYLVPGLTMSVTDARSVERGGPDVPAGDPSRTSVYASEGGVVDYVNAICGRKGWTPVAGPVHLTGEGTFTEAVPVADTDGAATLTEVERHVEVDVALIWTDGDEPAVTSVVNIVPTPNGGTHLAGFDRALTRAVNEAAKDLKVMKAADSPAKKDDVQEGLVAVVAVRVPEPKFVGQTKEELGTGEVTSIAYGVVADGMRDWFATAKHRSAAKAALGRVVESVRIREAARERRDLVRRKSALESSSSLPAKLKDCRSSDTDRTELFIVEGDSALGTGLGARDSEFQAMLPLRGKILNAAKARESEVLRNEECSAIISSLGAGSGKSFDLSAMRYQRVVLMADADVDGAHIRTLVLALFHRLMRPLLDDGRVYSAMPPLYRLYTSTTDYIDCYSDTERDAAVAQMGREPNKVLRFKGLGEMSTDELAETAVDPTTRTLKRISVADGEAADEVFRVLMGKEVAPRREFIVTRADELDEALLDV